MNPIPQPSRPGSRLFDLLPEEIIESWIRGEYLLGVSRNIGYDYIGWSLYVRGFFHYELHVQEGESEKSVKKWSEGYCLIDLKDGELMLWGIRTKAHNDQEKVLYLETGFFQSEFSKLILPHGRVHELPAHDARPGAIPIVYFGYRFYTVERNPKLTPQVVEICQRKSQVCESAQAFLKKTREALELAVRELEASPGDAEIEAEAKARASYELAVYEYLTDSAPGRFRDDFSKIREAFEDYDEETDAKVRRNLFAIIQLHLKRHVKGTNDLEADFDRITDRLDPPLPGRMRLYRRDVLNLIELSGGPQDGSSA